jgi:hypothetical protein
LSTDKIVFEIGTFCGASTVAMANKAITVKINNHIPINQRNKKQNFTKIPDFRGKCLREVFAILSRKQLIPIVKGIGPVVVKQYPAPGSSWKHKKIVLWMGFCDGSDKVQ